jgi:DNA-binding HxlR family transcriptional regulator
VRRSYYENPSNYDVRIDCVATHPSQTAVSADQCIPAAESLARAFRFLGKRWTAVVLGHLSAGPAGFRELSRAIDGISDSVLSDRLAELAGAGLLARTVDEGPPVAVSYELTERGRALMPALEQVAIWAKENLPADSG